MKTYIKFACPLDCFDACALIATVVDGRVIKVHGDPHHPLTGGRICPKGKKHLARLYHPQRLTRPLKRIKGKLQPVGWDEVLDEIAERLDTTKKQYGSKAVLHHTSDGYGGLLKCVDQLFFHLFGGVTVPRGSLCWGAGMTAQTYDFGDVKGHAPEDVINARTIVLWGRNPVATNIHMVPFLRQAQKAGATTILIDPIKTASARLSDAHIAIKPATDGALALGMANIMITEGLMDQAFIRNRTQGFNRFSAYVQAFTPPRVAAITGLKEKTITWLAHTYARQKPAAIILGYGLQRYGNGGNNIRCIDALGAVSGNIGVSGGGVSYANRSIVKYIDTSFFKPEAKTTGQRTYSIAQMGKFAAQADNPRVRFICVTKANPLVQCPNLNRTLAAFKQVDYKVVIDMFMTDTARHADIVLPCTSILEEEDIVFSSMYSPYLNYSAKVVDAPPGVLSEYDLFRQLALKLALPNYPDLGRTAFLEAALKPLLEAFELTMTDLKDSHFKIPNQEIPWAAGPFDTPSGKYAFYAARAAQDGQSPLPSYIDPQKGPSSYNLRLITPHTADSINSQHMGSKPGIPKAHVNPRTLGRQGLTHGSRAAVETEAGSLDVTVCADDRISDGIVMIYQGGWHKNGAVNFLTPDGLSDMGEQAAYYDCFCRLVSSSSSDNRSSCFSK